MKSVVANFRKDLEARGDYVALGNISSGWFAVSLGTWRKRAETAVANGRQGPNMSFAEFYGPEVAYIIHVHHLIELNRIGREYEVDPIRDLRPVCPNCHAVIHSRKKPYSIEEAAALIWSLKGRQ